MGFPLNRSVLVQPNGLKPTRARVDGSSRPVLGHLPQQACVIDWPDALVACSRP